MTTSVDLADLVWAAGFFDGEGCIMIKHKRSGRRQFFLVIQVTNTSKETIDWFQSTFGGHIFQLRRSACGHRPCWDWNDSGPAAAAVLRVLLPYLRLKRREAETAIAFQDRVDTVRAHRWNPMSDEEYAWRLEQKDALSRLKRISSD